MPGHRYPGSIPCPPCPAPTPGGGGHRTAAGATAKGGNGWAGAAKGGKSGTPLGATPRAHGKKGLAMHIGTDGCVSAHPGYTVRPTPQYAWEHLPWVPEISEDPLHHPAAEGHPGQKPSPKGGGGWGTKGKGAWQARGKGGQAVKGKGGWAKTGMGVKGGQQEWNKGEKGGKGVSSNYWEVLGGEGRWRNPVPGQKGGSLSAQRGYPLTFLRAQCGNGPSCATPSLRPASVAPVSLSPPLAPTSRIYKSVQHRRGAAIFKQIPARRLLK